MENLAWKPDQLLRVSLILAKLAERKITDNWANTPENTLNSIYRWRMPQTAASLDERKKALEALARRFPAAAWRICLDQVDPGSTIGHYNHRPRWRSDASGAGQPDTRPEAQGFVRAGLDLALAWQTHDATTLPDLVGVVHVLPAADQDKVWDLVDAWAEREQDNAAKAVVREHIRRFAFTRRSKNRRIDSRTKDRARRAHANLTPRDVVIRHQWLFAAHWLQESVEEIDFSAFLTRCLAVDDPTLASKLDELVGGFMRKLSRDIRLATARSLAGSLPPDQMCRLLKVFAL